MKSDDKGYQQVVQNLAYEVFKISKEYEEQGKSPDDMLKEGMFGDKQEYWIKIDDIIRASSQIYSVNIKDLQQDILLSIMEYNVQDVIG